MKGSRQKPKMARQLNNVKTGVSKVKIPKATGNEFVGSDRATRKPIHQQ